VFKTFAKLIHRTPFSDHRGFFTWCWSWTCIYRFSPKSHLSLVDQTSTFFVLPEIGGLRYSCQSGCRDRTSSSLFHSGRRRTRWCSTRSLLFAILTFEVSMAIWVEAVIMALSYSATIWAVWVLHFHSEGFRWVGRNLQHASERWRRSSQLMFLCSSLCSRKSVYCRSLHTLCWQLRRSRSCWFGSCLRASPSGGGWVYYCDRAQRTIWVLSQLIQRGLGCSSQEPVAIGWFLLLLQVFAPCCWCWLLVRFRQGLQARTCFGGFFPVALKLCLWCRCTLRE
jgi:hypothetical protein